MSIVLFIITYLSTFFVSAYTEVENKYPVREIPQELLKGADAVVRDYNLDFEVSSVDKSATRYHIAITILNKNGNKHNSVYVRYHDHSKINYLKAYLYNRSGELIKKLKKSDIEDRSAIPNGTMYGDDRLKIASLESNQYPYTVEFEYEVEKRASLFYPIWAPIDDFKMSLQKATFKVSTPSSLTFRFREQHIDEPVEKTNLDGRNFYKWKLENIPPVKTETYGPPFTKVIPMIYTAPVEFSMDGYQGEMGSWEDFGQWINKLNSGKDDLPQSIEQELKELTAGITNQREKVKKVYQFLQGHTRYVSIQLGIGGYQPFSASYVAEKGYGDCKALTNYTMAMLDALDIKSYYTLVKAGENVTNIDVDFPSNRFNHAFLCVPLDTDTLWLECTSQTSPFGYLGSFTSDRDVLVITEDGGKIVHTPIYKQEENRQITNADIFLDKEGNVKVEARIIYTGLQFENNDLNFYLHKGYDEQKKWLYEHLDISGARIDDFNLSSSGDYVPEGKKTLSLTVPKYASVNGKRIFLQPNMLNRINHYPRKMENRKTKVYLKTAGLDFDTVTYHLPEGYHVEFKPEITRYESPFGVYTSEIKVEERKVTLIRSLKINRGVFPPESYEELRKFFKKIVKSDQAKIVFINST